ncbi:unnamed protein product [Meganyctiphanes norvegica]|uniref:Leucine-rich repeat-containing protein 42 n=1 Tax=Meganyctiphanes norvegica TaxID=48144 RepID=A0AAV2R968_MEGNR
MCVESLLNLCIKYVSLNMHLVESLVGFPDIIGEQIFEACITNGQMEEDSPATGHAIALFGEAYYGLFMDSLECHSLDMISEFGECLVGLAMHVTHLNLSDCHLGNGSEFLRVFMDMPNLETLNIAGNDLDVEGFKLMFTRYKVFKNGFESLQVLDISRNKVNVNIVRIIVTLPYLKKLKVSMCDEINNENKNNVEEWTKSLKKARFEISSGKIEDDNIVFNSGWGKRLLEHWNSKMLEWQEIKKKKSQKIFPNLQQTNSEIQESDSLIEKAKSSQAFYMQSLKLAQITKSKSTQKCSKFSTYVYIKQSSEKKYLLKNVTNIKVQNNKRKMDFENSSQKKIPKVAQTIDMELLKMYMKK